MDYPVTTDIDALIARLSGHDERWRSGDYSWVLTSPGEDRAIGTVACSVAGHAAEFGYIINGRYWGRGLATEAARGIVSWVFSVPSLRRLSATCDVENAASARVLEKCGLTLEGTLRRAVIRPNISSEPRDALLYSKVRETGATEA